MTQSRIASLVETCASIAIGFVVSLALTAVVLPAHGYAVTMADNLQITAIFTVASIARGYLVRRVFVRLGKSRVVVPPPPEYDPDEVAFRSKA